MPKNYVAVIDGGGTNVRVALVSSDGRIRSYRKETPCFEKGNDGFNEQLNRMRHNILEQAGISEDECAGWMSAFAGPYDRNANELNPTNCSLHPITFPRDMRIPVINDVAAGSYGIFKFDNDVRERKSKHKTDMRGIFKSIYWTISTGTNAVSTILHVDETGREHVIIEHGIETGHIPVADDRVLCACGQYGCMETVVSGTGINRMMRELCEQNGKEMPDDMTPKKMYEELCNSEEGVMWHPIVKRVSDVLYKGMSAVVSMHLPHVIKFGGSMMNDYESIVDMALGNLEHRAHAGNIDIHDWPFVDKAKYRDEYDIHNMPLRGAGAYFFDFIYEPTKRFFEMRLPMPEKTSE